MGKWNIYHKPSYFTARDVSRPRGIFGINGKILLERILNRRQLLKVASRNPL